MKKVGNFFKRNIKVVVAFVLGGIVFGGGTYVVATSIAASNITYTGNGQSTVKGALDTLYTKKAELDSSLSTCNSNLSTKTSQYNTCSSDLTAKTCRYNKYLSLAKVSYKGDVIATGAGVCFIKNNTEYCFRPNDYTNELAHLKSLFSGGSVTTYSSGTVMSDGSNTCGVYKDGDVWCSGADSTWDRCTAYGDGSYDCTLTLDDRTCS